MSITCDVCKDLTKKATLHICAECLAEIGHCDFCSNPCNGRICDSCAEKAKSVIFPEKPKKSSKKADDEQSSESPKKPVRRRTRKKQKGLLASLGNKLKNAAKF